MQLIYKNLNNVIGDQRTKYCISTFIQYEIDVLGHYLMLIILADVWIIIQCFEIFNGSVTENIKELLKSIKYYEQLIKIKICIDVV